MQELFRIHKLLKAVKHQTEPATSTREEGWQVDALVAGPFAAAQEVMFLSCTRFGLHIEKVFFTITVRH